ncbi:MAG: hypothetical protein AB8B56_20150 [Crocinitomicaceae bacterium]
MALLKKTTLQKLTIVSYDEVTRTADKNTIEVMFNPESIQRSYNNRFGTSPTSPGKQEKTEYTYSTSPTVRMKLIIDGTQVHQYGFIIGLNAFNGTFKSVSERIQEFEEYAVKSKGEIHQPPFLKLKWGTLDFSCRVQSMDINYTLFDKSGDPLRAELSLSFVEDDAFLTQVKKANQQSPDLTHYRMVKEGDQLPLMCNDIYGSPAYYTLVARANKLKDFRNLTPGQEIYFPPIEK